MATRQTMKKVDRIVLRLVHGSTQLKKRGVWVFRGGEPLSAATVEETTAQVRRERDEHNLGGFR
jgi:hypothetical protein